MALSIVPTDWLESWSEDATNITVPLATFPEVTAAEADAATGDIRKIVFAIMEKLFQEFNERATADRPTRMTITRGTSVNDETGEIVRTYTVTFTAEAAVGGIEVQDEPS